MSEFPGRMRDPLDEEERLRRQVARRVMIAAGAVLFLSALTIWLLLGAPGWPSLRSDTPAERERLLQEWDRQRQKAAEEEARRNKEFEELVEKLRQPKDTKDKKADSAKQ